MTLEDFLATATADNVQAVADAKEYPVIFDSLKATAGRLKGVLGETPDPDFGTKWLQAKALASGSAKASDYYTLPNGITNAIIQTIFDMALDEIAKTDGYIELDPADPMGPKNRQSIAILVLCGIWPQTLADKVVALGKQTTYPFKNATLHTVLVARGVCPTIELNRAGHFVTIRVTSACEDAHAPRLLGKAPSGNWQSINSFKNVKEPGLYDCLIPYQWLSQPLAVDNAYGVIEAV